MQNSSETDVALDPVLASRILSGETGLASIAEDLIHLLERTAFGLRYLRWFVSFATDWWERFPSRLTRKYTQATPMQVTTPKKIYDGISIIMH
jgi:hypothetical protein